MFAFPSGLLASVAFAFYSDNTIALYIMWKTLQVIEIAIKKKKDFYQNYTNMAIEFTDYLQLGHREGILTARARFHGDAVRRQHRLAVPRCHNRAAKSAAKLLEVFALHFGRKVSKKRQRVYIY